MRVLTRANLGGPTRQAIALWHAHRELGLATLLATGEVGGDEAPLSPADAGVPALGWDEALRRGPEAEGWVVVPHLGRGVAPLADLRAGRALSALLAQHRPDVVHTHTSKAGWVGRRAADRAGVPVLAHTFHGHVLKDYFGGLASAWLARNERALARVTDVLIAVSGSCADELAAAGVAPRSRLCVVPPAVAVAQALPREQARRQLEIPPGEFRIACVGRLVPIKRVEHFVQVLSARPDWRGDVVGDGPGRASLAARIGEACPGRVRLLGALPAIARQLSAYDALVLPSVREGCPLVAVEAFAAGIPVVGYDVPGVRDVLSAWGKGLLVPPAAGPAGLAAAVDRLRDEPGLSASCVAGGAAAVARFEPRTVAGELASLYRAAQGTSWRYHPGPAG